MKVPRSQYSKFLIPLFKILFGLLCLISSAKVNIDLVGIELLSISLQTFALLIMSRLLGFKLVTIVTISYITLGLFGFNVFSSSPTGFNLLASSGAGYILGFLVCLPIASLTNYKFRALFMQFFIAHLVILSCGSVALSLNLGLVWDVAMIKGFIEFLPAAMIKSLLAALVVFMIIKPLKI